VLFCFFYLILFVSLEDQGSIINVSREESTVIAPTKKKGLFSNFFSRREDKKGKDKEKDKERDKEPFPISESDSLISSGVKELQTNSQPNLRPPAIRATSFETAELETPSRKVKRAKSTSTGHAATDTEGISASFEPESEANEEQSVPLDDDEHDSVRKPKRKMRKTKSIRISVTVENESEPILRESKDKESIKRKRKKHRTTDLTSKMSKTVPHDEIPTSKDDSLQIHSARSKKRSSFRKSMQSSHSEHSKTSSYAATLKSRSKTAED